MWMPRQLPKHAKALKALGLEMPAGEFADPKKAPLAAAVSLGGCSASFVSSAGLMVTNHHCITGVLQYNSTPEKNLLKDGFSATSNAKELWAGPTQKVYVAKRITDVTDQVKRGLKDIEDPRARYEEYENREKELIAACEKGRPAMRCRVAGFFGGDEHHLIEQLQLRDVRLVYAPPASVGNYGGDIDNWMWPRHTGDFAFLRAYVGADGEPADHGDTNIPFKPAHHLRVAKTGVSKEDLVFVMGYPGRTSRLATAHSAESAVSWRYPRSIKSANEYLGVIDELTRDNPTRRIIATPWIRGLENYKKKYEGLLEGLMNGGLLDERTDTEARLALWIADTTERAERYGDLLPALKALQKASDATREQDAATSELLRYSRLVGIADTIVHMAKERVKPDAERDPGLQERNWKRIEAGYRAMDKRYDRALDKGMLFTAVKRALRLPKDQRPTILSALVGNTEDEEKIEKKLDRLYARTRLENADTRINLFRSATMRQLNRSNDPFIQAALKLRPALEEIEARQEAISGDMLLLRPRYTRALRDMRGKPTAPDANSTLRVSYGTVKGYAPSSDRDVYHPFTYGEEMAEKHKGEEPFDAPSPLLAAIKAKNYGPYAVDGKLPIDFLSDIDITNGNSGSPTLNGRGELVGLAFDGNYEAMASDWMFMPKITRAIHTDIRYVLWVLDLMGGDHVLAELGVTESL